MGHRVLCTFPRVTPENIAVPTTQGVLIAFCLSFSSHKKPIFVPLLIDSIVLHKLYEAVPQMGWYLEDAPGTGITNEFFCL